VEGTPYERGVQHGKALAGEIRFFYTKFLSAGLIPWLNREQDTIAEVLTEYEKAEYGNGQFAYRVLLDSGLNLLDLEFSDAAQDYINRNGENPLQEYIDEMRGVADGSGVSFERLVILNTFLDTLFGMRAVIFAIRNLQEPSLVFVAFEQERDGEWVEVGRVDPFLPSPFASIAEIPTNARIRFLLQDKAVGEDPHGIDPAFVRIQLNRQVFLAGDPCVEVAVSDLTPDRMEVVFTPPAPLEPAALQSLQIQAGDKDYTNNPPPIHANVMRDERTAFTTEGYAEKYGILPDELHKIRNLGDVDERLQPTSLSFALRGSATSHGQVLAAHHFTGLDNDTAHRSGAVIVHKPRDKEGTPGKPFITVGIAGVIWGSSGMSSDGLAYMYSLSDTHDNPVTWEVLEKALCLDLVEEGGLGKLCLDLGRVKLLTSGTPIGFLMREMMQASGNASAAAEYLKNQKMSFGWNILLADAQGGLVAVERDRNILNHPDGGYFTYTPVNPAFPSPRQGNLDSWGRPWASTGPDDLRMAMHFQANQEDFDLLGLLREQRYWTTYYYRSLRTFYLLGDEIADAYGDLDVEAVQRILRVPVLNDMRNSMNSAIYAPDELKMWFALGDVPATSAPYREVNFGTLIGK